MNGIDLINYIQQIHDDRIDRGMYKAPLPENNKQVKYIIKHLGISDGQIIPDRSDTSWIKFK